MSNNIITKDNFKSLSGLAVNSPLIVNKGDNTSFAILANQINWGDKTYTAGSYTGKSYSSILGIHLDGPYTYNMFDALEKGIGIKINERIDERIGENGEVIVPPIDIVNDGKGSDTYLANLIVDHSNNHKLTAYYKPLPSVSVNYHKDNITWTDPIPATYYVNRIQSNGHTLDAYLGELPSTPTISVKGTTGTATGKYISGISASGHSISYTYADIPSLSIGTKTKTSSTSFISSIIANGHSISYTYSDLPKLPSVKQNNIPSVSIGTGYYLSGLHISHNPSDNSYTFSYAVELIPEIPEISIDRYEGDDFKLEYGSTTYYPWYDKTVMEGKYVSFVGIIPDPSDSTKHKITTVINDLPTANQLWGNYVPKRPYTEFYDENENIFKKYSEQALNSSRDIKVIVYNTDKVNTFKFGCNENESFSSADLVLKEGPISSTLNKTCTYTYTVTFRNSGNVRLETEIEYSGGGINYNNIDFHIPSQGTASLNISKHNIMLVTDDIKQSDTPTPYPIPIEETILINGNMDSIEISNKNDINTYFETKIEKLDYYRYNLYVKSIQSNYYNINVDIELTAKYSNKDKTTKTSAITVNIIKSDATTTPAPAPPQGNPPTGSPNQLSSLTAPEILPEPTISSSVAPFDVTNIEE